MVSPYVALFFALTCAGCSPAPAGDAARAASEPAAEGTAAAMSAQRLAPAALGQDGRITFSPGFSPDGQAMYFTRADCQRIWECPQLLYVSRWQNGAWSPAERVDLPQSDARAEWPSVSPDGATLYFSWSPDRPRHSGQNVDNDFDLFSLALGDPAAQPVALDEPDINRIRGGQVRTLRFVNNETAPVLTGDGDLYFWSERLDGVGLRDIYVARSNDTGGFMPPEPVPGAINTAGEDDGSWVSADGRIMLLSTEAENSVGGGDVSVSVLTDGEWSAPRNLGPGVNSSYSDFAARITPDGETVVFTSSRPVSEASEPGLFQVWSVPVAASPVLVQALEEARS